MFENHFYNESTRRMVSVFGSIFNDMEVVKKDSSGKILREIKVPLGEEELAETKAILLLQAKGSKCLASTSKSMTI